MCWAARPWHRLLSELPLPPWPAVQTVCVLWSRHTSRQSACAQQVVKPADQQAQCSTGAGLTRQLGAKARPKVVYVRVKASRALPSTECRAA